ncbi:MAG: hypothetical protein G3M78_10115 [Candidatus Nitrohelix vancouverensis]|uniref:Uncharacterized protein n=1 Tax=Candidatus Nitrohelix vancouverensis TaxID=2705534 RepID=A0A7T0C3A1_9BACT|nr:MAG: hypothetical protein G3M78_10115 [Candidatus Nitrohelix vancouverensis]
MQEVVNGNGLKLEFTARDILNDMKSGSGRCMSSQAAIYMENSSITDQQVIVERYGADDRVAETTRFKLTEIKEAVVKFMDWCK